MNVVPGEVSLHCPHCGRYTAVTPAPLSVLVEGYGMPHPEPILGRYVHEMPFYPLGGAVWWLGKCNACQEPVLVKGQGSMIHPLPQPGPVSDSIPDPMRSDLGEAKRCLSAGAWNAAAVMARRALQSAAVEQGAPKGRLWEQIAWLDTNRKITSQQRAWADAARWVGNHGAHDTEPDVAAGLPVITNVSEEDAGGTIKLVEHLFETLYVATHAANEQLSKRGKLKP